MGTPAAIPLDDPALPQKIRARDPEVLQAVVHTYLPQILRAAVGAGLDLAQAEDVAQSTFATFLESAPRFEGRSHVRSWLFGILYNKISEARRASGRERQSEAVEDGTDYQFSPDGHWARPPRLADAEAYAGELQKHIDDCLLDAPVSQRLAFILRDVMGFSGEETAEILEVSTNNLGVLLYRVRNRLRNCLEAKGLRASKIMGALQ
jgi:RNA polymerase sigma-70 factor (ECF subfamily)